MMSWQFSINFHLQSQGMGSFHSAYVQILESCERFVQQHGNRP